jgi:hypothetical protein
MTAEQQRAIDYAVGMIYRSRNSFYLEMVVRVKIKELLAQRDTDLAVLREENERLRASLQQVVNLQNDDGCWNKNPLQMLDEINEVAMTALQTN